MSTRILIGCMLIAPVVFGQTPKKPSTMSADMRQAIAFERHKDMAAARQALKEKTHPSVTYSNANRSVEEQEKGQKVQDKGPAKKDR